MKKLFTVCLCLSVMMMLSARTLLAQQTSTQPQYPTQQYPTQPNVPGQQPIFQYDSSTSTSMPQPANQVPKKQKVNPADYRATPCFFTGLGGNVGYEANGIDFLGIGGSANFGYRFNAIYSVLLQMDVIYTSHQYVSGASATYLAIPVVPTFKMHVFEDAFFTVGAGAVWLHSNIPTHTVNDLNIFQQVPGSTASAIGFAGEVGVGYDFWVLPHLTLTPQVGVNVAHALGSNLIYANLRAQASYYFW